MFISEIIFDTEDFELMRTENGHDVGDDSLDWKNINPEDQILGGMYLLKLPGLPRTFGLDIHL